jgi:hypothetical protein
MTVQTASDLNAQLDQLRVSAINEDWHTFDAVIAEMRAAPVQPASEPADAQRKLDAIRPIFDGDLGPCPTPAQWALIKTKFKEVAEVIAAPAQPASDDYKRGYELGLQQANDAWKARATNAVQPASEPVLWVRMLNGEVDWSEDCVGPDSDVADNYEESYEAGPLDAAAPPQPASEPLPAQPAHPDGWAQGVIAQPASSEDVKAMCAKLDEAYKAFDDYGLRWTLTEAAAMLRTLAALWSKPFEDLFDRYLESRRHDGRQVHKNGKAIGYDEYEYIAAKFVFDAITTPVQPVRRQPGQHTNVEKQPDEYKTKPVQPAKKLDDVEYIDVEQLLVDLKEMCSRTCDDAITVIRAQADSIEYLKSEIKKRDKCS